MTFNRNDIKFNILFWIAYYLYEWLVPASLYSEYTRYFINASVIVPITLAASVFTVYVLFKQLHLKGKKKEFWIGLIISMFVFILIRRSFNYFYTYPNYYPEVLETMSFWLFPKLIIEGVSIYLIVGLHSLFYFIKAWFEQQRLSDELKQEKTEAELKLLKSQIHPHFIFNTLNNIYSYAQAKNDKTADLIYQLSSFLSYSLYENRAAYVPLRKEIEIINCYVELERIRYGERLDISINVFDKVEQSSISPLLLLPLIENCFKHGFSSSIDKCWIRIDISKNMDWLVFKIENSLGTGSSGEKNANGGIGLKNVKRRLEISYPGKHELKIRTEEDTFLAVLKIKDLSN